MASSSEDREKNEEIEENEEKEDNKRIKAKLTLRRADAVCLDVDSTVCVDEAVDMLAEQLSVGNEVRDITLRAMTGSLDFAESYDESLRIINPSLKDFQQFISGHPHRLTDGVQQLVSLLHARRVPVYLISGGFERLIWPIAAELGIPRDHVFATKVIFNSEGRYAGHDKNKLCSQTGGKTRVIENLKSTHGYKNLVMIGDGSNDLDTYPTCDTFIGFGGNKVRENVKQGAPWFVHSFSEITQAFDE